VFTAIRELGRIVWQTELQYRVEPLLLIGTAGVAVAISLVSSESLAHHGPYFALDLLPPVRGVQDIGKMEGWHGCCVDHWCYNGEAMSGSASFSFC
jgi:hypothetical protein